MYHLSSEFAHAYIHTYTHTKVHWPLCAFCLFIQEIPGHNFDYDQIQTNWLNVAASVAAGHATAEFSIHQTCFDLQWRPRMHI